MDVRLTGVLSTSTIEGGKGKRASLAKKVVNTVVTQTSRTILTGLSI